MSFYTGALERAAAAASGASAALFASLSALRGKRFFHPDGETFTGTTTFLRTSYGLSLSGATPTQLRLSRGAGFPGSLPDVFGLAIKWPEFEQDLLLATSGDNAITRHLLLPASSFFSMAYSSVLPYELHEALIVFGARADSSLSDIGLARPEDLRALVATGKLRFDLTISTVGSNASETFGSLVVDGYHEGDIRFNPWNCSPPLRPAGSLNRLRLQTYKASQAARPSQQD